MPPCVRCVCKIVGLWDRLRAGSTSFWGIRFLSGMLLVLAPPGAVPVVGGGVFGPLGTTVPWGVASESAGRPMGPATLL